MIQVEHDTVRIFLCNYGTVGMLTSVLSVVGSREAWCFDRKVADRQVTKQDTFVFKFERTAWFLTVGICHN